jgi:hypothetical protein
MLNEISKTGNFKLLIKCYIKKEFSWVELDEFRKIFRQALIELVCRGWSKDYRVS